MLFHQSLSFSFLFPIYPSFPSSSCPLPIIPSFSFFFSIYLFSSSQTRSLAIILSSPNQPSLSITHLFLFFLTINLILPSPSRSSPITPPFPNQSFLSITHIPLTRRSVCPFSSAPNNRQDQGARSRRGQPGLLHPDGRALGRLSSLTSVYIALSTRRSCRG